MKNLVVWLNCSIHRRNADCASVVNFSALSNTIASISVLFGLLGTTIGMIRAFAAFGDTGTVDATQLAIGISEALYNTAGGLIGAIIAIIMYNFFTTKVDNYVYMIDEAILNITHIFTIHVKGK